jgi:hypothetical protein
MKQAFVPILALAALLAGLFALYRSYEAKPSQGSPETETTALPEKKEEAHEHGHEELAEYMMRLQWYANKLYFAGEAGNQPLADFYLHENLLRILGRQPYSERRLQERWVLLSGSAIYH